MTYNHTLITHITIQNISIHLTMSTMTKPVNNKSIKIQQDFLYVAPLKDIMLRSLLMVKLVQERHIQWKDLDIICMMIKGV